MKLSSFNKNFHQYYTRLQDPCMVNDASSNLIYCEALDNINTTFVKRVNPTPCDLVSMYVEVVKDTVYLG